MNILAINPNTGKQHLQDIVLLSIGTGGKAAAAGKATPTAPALVIPPVPSLLTTCDAGGCWDSLGNRYNGTGTTLVGPTGKLCIRIGDRIECP